MNARHQFCSNSPLSSLGPYLREKIQMPLKYDIFVHKIRQLICQHAIKFQMLLNEKSLIVIQGIGSV